MIASVTAKTKHGSVSHDVDVDQEFAVNTQSKILQSWTRLAFAGLLERRIPGEHLKQCDSETPEVTTDSVDMLELVI